MKKGITITVIFLVYMNLLTIRAENDSVPLISSWTLIKYYSSTKNTEIDTLLHSFQNYNPVFKYSISNSFLGNIGSPSISNIYSNRKEKNNFLLINAFNPYMSTFSNTKYINTRKPFTILSYTNGGKESIKEETLEAFHTQNVNKYLNLGIKYNLISANGQYKFQKIVNNAFKIFTSYEKHQYKMYSNLNLNKIKADENGGIINDSLLTNSTFQNTNDIPTVFGGTETGRKYDPDVLTTIKNLGFLMVQELNIVRQTNNDTLKTIKEEEFMPAITHILQYDKSIRIHRDKAPNAGLDEGLYSKTNFNPDYTLDSICYRQLSNTLRLNLKNINKKRNVDINLDLTHELIKYSFYTPSSNQIYFAGDTSELFRFINHKYNPDTFNRTRPLSNTSASFNVSCSKSNILNYNIWTSYFFSGYKTGSYSFNAEFMSFLGNTDSESSITLLLDYNNETPDFLLQTCYSNYFIWKNNFKSIRSTELDLRYTNSSKKIETGINYSSFSNYIYFDTIALPQQTENNLSVVSLHFTKFLKFWKFRLLNKIACQSVNNPGYLSLPEFVLYNSTYIEQQIHFKLTNGGFSAMLGFDVYYNSKYYTNAYNPALGVFHQQSDKKLGSYPYLDVFLNIKLKRTRFFFKYEHVNSNWIYENYFSVLHYPRNERMFKIGISWTFYD